MTSKMKLLASVAIAATSFVGASTASASDWYMNVSGGANWLHDDAFAAVTGGNDTTTFVFDNDPSIGFVLSAAVGKHLDNVLPGLRVEGEFAYRENDVGGIFSSDIGQRGYASGSIDYQHSSYSLLANAWYDFNLMGMKPYVGGGLGWGHVNVDGNMDGSPFAESDGGFAWQLGAGVNLDIQPGMTLNIGYRYFSGPDITVFAPAPLNSLSGDVSDKNDSVVVGVTFGL